MVLVVRHVGNVFAIPWNDVSEQPLCRHQSTSVMKFVILLGNLKKSENSQLTGGGGMFEFHTGSSGERVD
jgi:hypothetical protein